MNKFLKVLVAILGAVDVTFSLFIPMFITLLMIQVLVLSKFETGLIFSLGILASAYRAIKFLVMDN